MSQFWLAIIAPYGGYRLSAFKMRRRFIDSDDGALRFIAVSETM